MKESCCQFGVDRHLAGIITEPDGAERRRGAVVLVTAGLVPSFGPFRLYTELARRLAEEGFATLRFDVEGIGDSLVAHPDMAFVERSGLAVRAAAELLVDQSGAENLVLAGLCSGAEDAFRAAAGIPAVRRVVMIDPFSYRTPGWLARNLLHRGMRRARRALGLFRPYPRETVRQALGGDPGPVVHYEYMRRDESAPLLCALLQRGTRVHFFYTGGSEAYNHRGQLQKMFPEIAFDDRVTVDYFPWMDHTQVLGRDREHLVEVIARRLATTTPA